MTLQQVGVSAELLHAEVFVGTGLFVVLGRCELLPCSSEVNTRTPRENRG